VKQVILEITKKRLGAAVVQGDQGQVLGIITDGDIRRMLEKYDNIADLTAVEIMNASPVTVDGNILAADAARMCQEKKISQIVVTEGEKYLGIVHLHDLSREGIL
jgi:arabinose-5-phosphate isomerase